MPKKSNMEFGYSKKGQLMTLAEDLAHMLGFSLVKKEVNQSILLPSNTKELDKLNDDELKSKVNYIKEDIQMIEKAMTNVKERLLDHFKKEGPTDFTNTLFSGTTIPENRLVISCSRLIDLQKQLDYIKKILKDKKKGKLIGAFTDTEITDITIEQGPTGMIMRVHIK